MPIRPLPFLGRLPQLAAADDGAEAARHGRRRLLTIEGAAGLGKSRLIDELARRIEGVSLRQAQAFPASSSRPGALAERLELDRMEADDPHVLLIDDIHVADATSIGELRSLLLKPTASAGLLVVVTHRPFDDRTPPELRRLIEAARRRAELDRQTIGPLTLAELADAVGGPDAEAVADRLIGLAGGVPVQLTSIIGELAADGAIGWEGGRLVAQRPVDDWPPIRSLHERVADLAEDERLLVSAAAIAGHPIALEVAARLLDRDADAVLDTAERLVAHGHLAEQVDGLRPPSASHAEVVAGELGELRKSRLLAALADAMAEAGIAEREPGVVGTHYLRAHRFEQAFPLLAEAGLKASARRADAEAYPLVTGAIEALEQIDDPDPETVGELYFARARCHRMLGDSALAADDAAEASRRLQDDGRMRALGWQAQIADDLQRATEGEWLTAAAEREAAILDDQGSLGVMLTLRAKMLGRLGLPSEADACLTSGIRRLRLHGDPYLHFLGRWNGAWVAFDRGQVRQAEAGFEHSALQAATFEGQGWVAQAEAWRGRSLFAMGRVTSAEAAFERALIAADEADTQTPAFLVALGRAEGLSIIGRYVESEQAASETIDLIRTQGLAWENVGRYVLATALHGQGRDDLARDEAERALAACPVGADGQRWRAAIRALLLEIRAASEPWPVAEAAALTRELLAGRWLLPVVRLLTVRARHEHDPDLGRAAAALAIELGVPMLAAGAVDAGELWDDPIAPAVAAGVQELRDEIPESWRADWSAGAAVAPALAIAVDDPEARRIAAEQREVTLAGLLAGAGLVTADLRVGPAEWTAPLPRPEVLTPRRRNVLAMVGIAAVIAVGGGVVGLALRDAPPSDPAAPGAATDVVDDGLPIIAAPGPIAGSWTFRGGPERTGVSERSGVPDLEGLYWEPFCTGGPVRSSPAVLGRMLFFGSDDGNLYALETDSGDHLWRRATDGAVRSSPVVVGGVGEGGLADRDSLVIVGSDSGIVSAWTSRGGDLRWSFPTGGRVESSPIVVDGIVYVGSRDGYLYAIEADGGAQLWRFPQGDPVGPIDSSPAVVGDLVYVGSHDGNLYAVDRHTGEQRWTHSTADGITATPVVSDGVVYIGGIDTFVWAVDSERGLPVGLGSYRADGPVRSSPAVDGGRIYVASSRSVIAFDLSSGSDEWAFRTRAEIVSSPAVAGDVVYVGSDDGGIYAIDRATGEPRWHHETGGTVSGSPAVADGAVFVGSWDGCIYALGGSAGGEDDPDAP